MPRQVANLFCQNLQFLKVIEVGEKKMDINRLPKVLVQTLDTLLSDSGLSTWSIKGGNFYTQIILRFDMAAMPGTGTTESVYRRVSDRRLQRDRDRARGWRQTQAQMVDMEDLAINQNSSLNANAEPYVHDVGHIGYPILNNIAEADNNTDTYSQGALSQDHDIQPQSPATASDQSCQQGINIEPVVQYQTEAVAVQDVNSDDLDQHSADIEILCNTCHKACNTAGNSWYRCTICNDFDICMPCHTRLPHKHFQHRQYKHLFTYPEDAENKPYCDSCGKVFEEPDMNVHQCPVCKDYVLCSVCAHEGMHSRHGKLNVRSLDDYLQDSDDDSIDISD